MKQCVANAQSETFPPLCQSMLKRGVQIDSVCLFTVHFATDSVFYFIRSQSASSACLARSTMLIIFVRDYLTLASGQGFPISFFQTLKLDVKNKSKICVESL